MPIDLHCEIVGVVADVKHRGLSAEVRPQVYTPLAQDPFNEFFVVLKTTGDPREFIAAARTAVLALDSEQPMTEIQTTSVRNQTSWFTALEIRSSAT